MAVQPIAGTPQVLTPPPMTAVRATNIPAKAKPLEVGDTHDSTPPERSSTPSRSSVRPGSPDPIMAELVKNMAVLVKEMRVANEMMTSTDPAPKRAKTEDLRDEAMRELRKKLKLQKIMQREMSHRPGEGVALWSPLDEVRYGPTQQENCEAACMKVAEEFGRVVSIMNEEGDTPVGNVTSEQVAEISEMEKMRRVVFGEELKFDDEVILPAGSESYRSNADECSMAAWLKVGMNVLGETRKSANELGGSVSHERLHMKATKVQAACLGPFKWGSRREWREAIPGDPKWRHADQQFMKDYVLENQQNELDMARADIETKINRLILSQTRCCLPLVMNIAVAKVCWDTGDECERAMITDAFLMYYPGVTGMKFVQEHLDGRLMWKHLVMSKKLMSDIMRQDDMGVTGRLDAVKVAIYKLTTVMTR